MPEPTMPVLAHPDIDRFIAYVAWWHSPASKARLRGWTEHRILVLSEVDDNDGASVTNGAEVAWKAVEDALGVDVVAGRWTIFEHYPRSHSLDVVTFDTRDRLGAPAGVKWSPVVPDLYERILGALGNGRRDVERELS